MTDQLWNEHKGTDGPGAGKHIVLVSGDEEYRSEEAPPMMAKILSTHHGFDCTVLKHLRQETCRGLEFALWDSLSERSAPRRGSACPPRGPKTQPPAHASDGSLFVVP